MNKLSDKKIDVAFDLVPLPSKGLLYKNVKESVRVSYLDGSDENILTSPNLLNSGEFLEILINRNLLDPNLTYRDLHVGDRNAIMLWLRTTSFGTDYPITVYLKNGDEYKHDFDLSSLSNKYKSLKIKPNENGLFNFNCSNGDILEFNFLTVGAEEDVEKLIKDDEAATEIVNKRSTYTLLKQIVRVNGSDSIDVSEYVSKMRLQDIRTFRKYISDNESGVDMKIEFKTESGEAVSTFLPINVSFFWPEFGV